MRFPACTYNAVAQVFPRISSVTALLEAHAALGRWEDALVELRALSASGVKVRDGTGYGTVQTIHADQVCLVSGDEVVMCMSFVSLFLLLFFGLVWLLVPQANVLTW